MFSWFKRSAKPEEKLPELSEWNRHCDDCEVEEGNLHELFCTRKRCPFCKGQLIYADGLILTAVRGELKFLRHYGRTAESLARERGHTEIAEILARPTN